MRAPLPPAFLTTPVAHRAYHDRRLRRPENSRAAMVAAIAAGYAIEMDLQLSSDGIAMVFHDDDLQRLTGHIGPVTSRTAAQLQAIPLLHGDGEGIPTFRQILDLVAGQTPLLIELKDQTSVMGPTDGRLEQATARDLGGYDGAVAVMSFNPHSVARMAELAPSVPRGLTTSAYDPADWHPLAPVICADLRDIAGYDPAQCSFISHEASDLARPRVAALKQQGAAILCWTIYSATDATKARKYADNITFEGYPA